MKRNKPHIKKEAQNSRSGGNAGGSGLAEEKELAYYIHDRVELMHQVFSLLRSREMRAMTPDCVKNLSMDHLQELCLEELLGISSKRLCAILDGADPPSDSASSESDERLETVSLDSISSVEQLSDRDEPQKRKRRCKRKEAKARRSFTELAKSNKTAAKPTKTTANNVGDKEADKEGDSRAAERAGMTVLELLELQARARAIRAQLALEHTKKVAATTVDAAPASPGSDSDGGVVIKEEPAEVVELGSSDDEDKKPCYSLQEHSAAQSTASVQNTVTKKNDLIIIVPTAKQHRRIKLNRTLSASKTTVQEKIVESPRTKLVQKEIPEKPVETPVEKTPPFDINKETPKSTEKKADRARKAIRKKKLKKKRKDSEGPDGSDHDEIMLQLSDSEKMDLLENFDRKSYSRSETEDSSSDSDANVDQAKTSKEKIITEQSHEEKFAQRNTNQEENLENKASPEIPVEEKTSEENRAKVVEENNKKDEHIDKTREVIKNTAHEEVNTESIDSKKSNGETIEVDMGHNINEIILNQTTNAIGERNLGSDKTNIECIEKTLVTSETEKSDDKIQGNADLTVEPESIQKSDKSEYAKPQIVISCIDDIPLQDEEYGPLQQNIETSVEKSPLHGDSNEPEVHAETEDNVEKAKTVEKETDNKRGSETEDSVEKAETMEKETDNKSVSEKSTGDKSNEENGSTTGQLKETEKNMSEGELTDRSSSEVEMFEKPSEIVCISDDDEVPKQPKKKKEKKKKEKKAKKEKKSKKDKKLDFREGADQNFFKESSTDEDNDAHNKLFPKRLSVDSNSIKLSTQKYSDSDDVYEICEISDDSSCYEVEGVSVLSKEPTSEEIAALSAKIDQEIERADMLAEERMHKLEKDEKNISKEPTTQEIVELSAKIGNNIVREEVISEEQIQEIENREEKIENVELENLDDISWKDRYLDSTKVKNILKTSGVLNAMRKKNKELKKKLAEGKAKEIIITVEPTVAPVEEEKLIEEGSIEHFNTLQGSNQFVEQIKELQPTKKLIDTKEKYEKENTSETRGKETNEEETKVTDPAGTEKQQLDKEMKKDAKQLLKMYKRLLKYNNVIKERDPNKLKKKKKNKQKRKEKITVVST